MCLVLCVKYTQFDPIWHFLEIKSQCFHSEVFFLFFKFHSIWVKVLLLIYQILYSKDCTEVVLQVLVLALFWPSQIVDWLLGVCITCNSIKTSNNSKSPINIWLDVSYVHWVTKWVWTALRSIWQIYMLHGQVAYWTELLSHIAWDDIFTTRHTSCIFN